MPHKPGLTVFRTLLCTLVVVAGLLEFAQGYSNALFCGGGIVALVTLLVVFPVTGKFTRTAAAILCLGGLAAALTSQKMGPGQLVVAFNEMNSLIALLAAVMLLGIALKMGQFADLFRRFYAGARHLYQPYILSLFISYILCIFSLMGAVAPAYYLIEENLKKLGLAGSMRLTTTSVGRGYAMAVIVSPAAATVGIAMKYSGLSWLQLVLPIFPLSIAGLAAAFFAEPVWRSKGVQAQLSLGTEQAAAATRSGTAREMQEISGEYWKRLLSFFLLLAGIIATITFLENVLHFSSLNSIAAGCMLVTFAWGALSGNLQPVLAGVRTYFKKGILSLQDQIVLLTAAGFFTFTMEHSGRMQWLGHFIGAASGRIGVAALLSLLPLIIVLLALVGLHPFASAIIIARALLLTPLYFPPLAMGAALMGGMSMAYVVAPFSGLILILVSLTGKSPYEVGVKWNYLFVALFLILTAIFITLVTYSGLFFRP